ncbi:36651_t:CDS:2, partial [Gigaspora margarita]
MKPHVDEHYCLVSVKMAKEFAATFANHSLIISQDDKAKVSLVYLIINLKNTNKTLYQGHLSIYIQPEYFVRTSSFTYMRDLINISKCDDFVPILKHGDHPKSIWILLVDGGLDKNLKHLKNIAKYCYLFRELNFDYLSVRMHAPYQSAYNSVERSMCILSKKLARIELSIDEF